MFSFLHHLLVPSHKNNFRAKILHNSSLVVLVLSFLILSAGFVFVKKSHPEVLGISYSITQDELLHDTNAARVANNEPPLTLNEELTTAAKNKADNMFKNNYWAHFGPDGTTPWQFIKAAGYSYSFAGENLAKGFTTSQDIVDAWMNSPSHRENLLSDKYKDIGFAVEEGTLQGEDTVLVVQMFGSTAVAPTTQNNVPPVSQKVANVNPPVVVTSAPQQVAGTGVKPLINSQKASKSLISVFLAFIIIVLLLDILIVEKKKIPRIVGHNLDHIILLIIFLLFVILSSSHGIL